MCRGAKRTFFVVRRDASRQWLLPTYAKLFLLPIVPQLIVHKTWYNQPDRLWWLRTNLHVHMIPKRLLA